MKKQRTNKEIWLTVKECAELRNVSKTAVFKSIRSGKYITREGAGNGGKLIEILLTSLPVAIQAKYHASKSVQITTEAISQYEMTVRIEINGKEVISWRGTV